MRAELDIADLPLDPVMGTAQAVAEDEDHGKHVFLYLPDLSSETRWSAHAVPTKEPPRERQPLGFRRSDR